MISPDVFSTFFNTLRLSSMLHYGQEKHFFTFFYLVKKKKNHL